MAVEKRIIKRYGVSLDEYRRIAEQDGVLRREGIVWTIIRTYDREKRAARKAGIEWKLTLTHLDWMFNDLKTWDRGSVKQSQFVLGRLDESMPLDYSNAVFDSRKPLAEDRIVVKRKQRALPVGVRCTGRRFVAVLRDCGTYRRIGPFTTAAEASTAYLNARHAAA